MTMDFTDSARKINAFDLGTVFVLTDSGEVLDVGAETVDSVPLQTPRTEPATLDLESHPEWSALSGFSQQYGYDGPINHPSEFIDGPTVREIAHRLIHQGRRSAPLAIVEVIDTEDPDAIVGWTVLEKKIDAQR